MDIHGVIIIVITIVMLVLPGILTLLNVWNLFLKTRFKPNLVDALIMILGPIFTVFLFEVWSAKDYNEALVLPSFDSLPLHTPIASWHLPTILTFIVLGIVGYGIVRICKLKLPPLVIVICISLMIISSVIGVVWIVQLSAHFIEGEIIPGETLYLCMFPLNYIICFISVIRQLIQEHMEENYKIDYNNTILNKCNLLLKNSKNWPILAVVLSFPILVITILVLVLFGQKPDAIIKAFTETSDWVLSQKISPPPIEVEAHYLCTVSLRGHKSIVKPLRFGIRRNNKIVVNRQLCVANAFEQLIQEKFPKIHYFIRKNYDKYGYPLSKHINSPLSADIVYILMKPLECFFVVVLYLIDKKPENRIALQYIPMSIRPKS